MIFLDLYLARLITSKQILAPYIDQFYNAILLEQMVYKVPPPIKFLFDFLEKQAQESLNKQNTLVSEVPLYFLKIKSF